MTPIQLFIGADPREQIGLHVFCSSVWRHTKTLVSITPIAEHVPSDGTNAFTRSRFLVPYFMGYAGMAIWADGSDMLCLTDIAELAALFDPQYAVQVVKHDYQTRHPTKYLDQPNHNYLMKNWSSLMVINCEHYAWRKITKDSISGMPGKYLHQFGFVNHCNIGRLPPEWNYLVDEPNQAEHAKIAHFTVGLPVWYKTHRYAPDWKFEFDTQVKHYASWQPDHELVREREHRIASLAARELIEFECEDGSAVNEFSIPRCQADDHLRECIAHLCCHGEAVSHETDDGYIAIKLLDDTER